MGKQSEASLSRVRSDSFNDTTIGTDLRGHGAIFFVGVVVFDVGMSLGIAAWFECASGSQPMIEATPTPLNIISE